MGWPPSLVRHVFDHSARILMHHTCYSTSFFCEFVCVVDCYLPPLAAAITDGKRASCSLKKIHFLEEFNLLFISGFLWLSVVILLDSEWLQFRFSCFYCFPCISGLWFHFKLVFFFLFSSSSIVFFIGLETSETTLGQLGDNLEYTYGPFLSATDQSGIRIHISDVWPNIWELQSQTSSRKKRLRPSLSLWTHKLNVDLVFV